MSVQANFADIHLRGMRDRSMRSETELAREIQLTDWSTAGEKGKLVFLVSTTPSLSQCISLFTTGKNRLWIVQVTRQFKFFSLRFLSRKKVKKKFVLTNKNFFRNFYPIRCLRARCEKTCLAGPLEYKYRVIFVLVLGVICTLRSAVG